MTHNEAIDHPIWIFNAIPIKVGGGLQKTRAIVREFAKYEDFIRSGLWLVAEGSPLVEDCRKFGFAVRQVPSHITGRIRSEIMLPFKVNRGVVIFNLGGTVMIASVGRAINVSECAYSNLLYPEVDFWKFEKGVARLKRAVSDLVRKFGVAMADEVIFQTEDLRDRALKLLGLSWQEVHIVPPSPSSLIAPDNVVREEFDRFRAIIGPRKAFLFACGEQKNKRLELLPGIAENLRCLRRDPEGFVFVLTIDENCSTGVEILAEARRLGCESNFVFLGSCQGRQYASLLKAVDFVCNFAVLESFSNNFVEAWRFGKPLIVTDASWAKKSAADAAVYVNPEDGGRAAELMERLLCDRWLSESIARSGYRRLQSYPTPSDKASIYRKVLLEARRHRGISGRLLRAVNWIFALGPRGFRG